METPKEIALELEADLISPENAVELIKEYAKQKCKEQRGICAKIAKDKHTGGYVEYDVKNAPEPEFD